MTETHDQLTRIYNKGTRTSVHFKDLKVLSLFSGCGGMDLGFEGGFEVHKNCINKMVHPEWALSQNKNWVKLPSTRFKTVFANDIRPGAQKVWQRFFSEKYEIEKESFLVESIVDRVKRYWDGEQDLFPKDIDIITGGFPCQDFSVAGKRKGFESHKDHMGNLIQDASEENRGKLYMWMREVIDIVQPKLFVAENVKGLVSLGDVKEIIQKDFESIGSNGYLVLEGKVLHAAEYGVPQSRERVIFLGLRKDALTPSALKALQQDPIPAEFDPFPIPTHSEDTSKNNHLSPLVKLKDIFSDLDEPEHSQDPDQQVFSKAKWYGKHCQGNKEVDISKIGPTIRSEHHGNIEFRRLSKEHGGSNIDELKSGKTERRLTIRECCRIQTFPDSYEFVGAKRGQGVNVSEAYKLIGNAVPPLLAYHIAKRLESIWGKLFK
jgi:DNA (cytosine-5)-methyltransferase 1